MPQEWREELGKRNRTSKTHRLYVDGEPTNKYSWDGVAGAPMHYVDSENEWRDIVTDLVPSTRNIVGFGNPAYEMIENEYEMFVLGELNSGVPVVRYEAKHTDYFAQFAAHNLQWTNNLDQIELIATPTATETSVADSEAKWPGCYGEGLDLRFVAGAGRMGKWLDIQTPLPDPPQFIIDGGNPALEFAEIIEFHADLEVWINGEVWNKKSEVVTTTEIEFRSPDGEIQFVFPVAMGYHSGEPLDVEPDGTYIQGEVRLKKQGPRLYITVRFPWSWLEVATCPVLFDTTVDKDVGASGDDGLRYNQTSFTTTQQIGYIGKIVANSYHIFARWTGVTIAGTIDTAHTQLYADAAGTGGEEMAVYGVDEDNPAAPTTYEEFDADPLTTAKVDWDETWVAATWEGADIELKAIFQELVDTYTIDNDAVMIQVKDDGGGNNKRNKLRFWDYPSNAWPPKVHIEYTSGGQVYHEEGKLVTVKAVLAETDLQSMVETDKLQTVLSVLAGTDAHIMHETGKSVVPLAVVSGVDSYIMGETGKSITVLAQLAETDVQSMVELGKETVILSATVETDVQMMKELGKLVTVLTPVAGTDGLLFMETGKTITILAQVAKTEQYTMGETGKITTVLTQLVAEDQATFRDSKVVPVLALTPATDIQSMIETGKSLTVLTPVSGVDSYIMGETGKQTLVLIGLAESDIQAMKELDKLETVLVVVIGHDVYIPITPPEGGGIWFDDAWGWRRGG